jgi:hypothetical protein
MYRIRATVVTLFRRDIGELSSKVNVIYCTLNYYFPCLFLLFSFPFCACCLLHAGFLLGLPFNPKNGGDMFLRNVG